MVKVYSKYTSSILEVYSEYTSSILGVRLFCKGFFPRLLPLMGNWDGEDTLTIVVYDSGLLVAGGGEGTCPVMTCLVDDEKRNPIVFLSWGQM